MIENNQQQKNESGIAKIAGPLNGLIGVSEICSVSTQTALDNTINTTTYTSNNRAYLFCVGTDGCGTIDSEVYTEDFLKIEVDQDISKQT